jgi:putative SbcD/Mre11-related phosphoesterase
MKFVGKSVLLADEGEQVLVLGDLHIGYEQGIHQAGVATSTLADLQTELEGLFARVGKVAYVVLLGDVIHRFRSVGSEEWVGVRTVFSLLSRFCERVVVVRGNHDVSLGSLLTEFALLLVDSWTWRGYCCVHGDRDLPELHTPAVHTWLVGHGHPAFCLQEGAKRELYKCFLEGTYQGKKIILCPSFFSGVIGTDVARYGLTYPWNFSLPSFRVYLLEGNEVLLFGTLEHLLSS